MPSEFLHFPPAYTLVGLYRLVTDPSIRTPVLDKVRHASVRGAIVALLYAVGSWRILDWFIKRFLIGGGGFLGLGRGKVGEAVKESVGGLVTVGLGRFSFKVDLVLYPPPCLWLIPDTHLLILLPQVSSILRFFIYKNLKIARSRAYALTVSSRRKPAEFWSQGYIEEWVSPPRPPPGVSVQGDHKSKEAKWISWILWWPTQLVLRHYLLLPLSPTLPLLSPVFTSVLRGITTAEYLHQPYFDIKGMDRDAVWRWIEERKWAYRVFGFAASLLERIPIIGLFLSISNRIGAAMWAFDLEKRQHLFANGIIPKLQPSQVGFYGSGIVTDLGIDIQKAEDELEAKWSSKRAKGGADEPVFELKGAGVGSAQAGREKLL